MKNNQLKESLIYTGFKISDGKPITGHLYTWSRFCTAIIAPIDCTRVSEGSQVNYFNIIPFNHPLYKA